MFSLNLPLMQVYADNSKLLLQVDSEREQLPVFVILPSLLISPLALSLELNPTYDINFL